MDKFFRIYSNLLSQLNHPVRRELLDEINWESRLIAVKGTRGVGKTNFLLQIGTEFFPTEGECLYVNMNHLYFTTHSLLEFAKAFSAQGGKVLLIDQIFKYPDWSRALSACYNEVPELKIVFAGPSAMRLKENNPYLHDIVDSYFLRGFSFREYLNLRCRQEFPSIRLTDLLNNHSQIAAEVCAEINPLDYFEGYLRHGFYPFFLENRDFTETLLKTVNMMIEGDIFFLKEIQVGNYHKIRRLLFLLANNHLNAPLNITRLSREIDTSRATVMNYIKYLMEARLINMLYAHSESDIDKKPSRIYLHNPNLLYALREGEIAVDDLYETFFYNQMYKDHKLYAGTKQAQFDVNGEYLFRIESFDPKGGSRLRRSDNLYVVQADLEQSKEGRIPLWLFGFLY